MKKIITIAIALITSVSISHSAFGAETGTGPGPNDLTWEQVSELSEGSASFSAPASNPRLKGSGMYCNLNTNYLHKRISASELKYGAVGIKPTTTCSVAMVMLSQSTVIYKTVWWGLQYLTGPVVTENSGVKSVTTKTAEVICNSLQQNEFQAIVTSMGIFPGAAGGIAGTQAKDIRKLDCGVD